MKYFIYTLVLAMMGFWFAALLFESTKLFAMITVLLGAIVLGLAQWVEHRDERRMLKSMTVDQITNNVLRKYDHE